MLVDETWTDPDVYSARARSISTRVASFCIQCSKSSVLNNLDMRVDFKIFWNGDKVLVFDAIDFQTSRLIKTYKYPLYKPNHKLCFAMALISHHICSLPKALWAHFNNCHSHCAPAGDPGSPHPRISLVFPQMSHRPSS